MYVKRLAILATSTITFLGFGRCFTQGTRGLGAGVATRVSLLCSRHDAYDTAHYPIEAYGEDDDDDEVLEHGA